MQKILPNPATITFLVLMLILPGLSLGQDLDPRAYIRVPVNGNFIISGFAYSHGGVVTDATLPLKNLKASVETPILGYMRSFNFLGKTATAFAAIPYSFAQVTADVNGQPDKATRSGFSDMRLRMSVLLIGAPATTVTKFAQGKQKTVLGVSLNIIAPTGQYFVGKLINLGTNRWAVRPELGLSQPLGKRWMIDLYAGVWLFTANHQYYTGKSLRTQDPLGAAQAHLSYNLKFRTWLAFDATYYAGGQSTINNQEKDDRQNNSRLGATLVLPAGKKGSLKLAASTGAIIRSGANFTTFSIGWQTTWFGKKQLIKK